MTSQASAPKYDEYFQSTIEPYEHPKRRVERFIKNELKLKVDTRKCCYQDGVFGRIVYEAKSNEDRMVSLDSWQLLCDGCAKATNYEQLGNTLNSFQHVNVVKYYTIAYMDRTLYAVREYNKYGNLEQNIDRDVDGYNVKASEIVRQLVAGLSYLHSRKFYLGVLTPANIIVAGENLVRIGGLLEFRTFYFSGLHTTSPDRSSCVDRECAGRYATDEVIQFVAPEVLDRREQHSFDLARSRGRADVWSIGMLALHMATVDYLLPGDRTAEFYREYAESGEYANGEHLVYLRPEAFSDDTCFRIMQGCVRPSPHERLSCESLESFLEDVRQPKKFCFPFDPTRQPHATDIAQLIEGLDDNVPICCRNVADVLHPPDDEWLTPSLLRLLISPKSDCRAPSCKEMDKIIRYLLHQYKKNSEQLYYVVNSEATGCIFRQDDLSAFVSDASLRGLSDIVGRGSSPKEGVLMPFVDKEGFWKVLILDPTKKAAVFYDSSGKMKENAASCLKPLSEAFKKHFDEAFNALVGMHLYGMQPSGVELPTVRNAKSSAWFAIYFVYLYASKRKAEADCVSAVHVLRMWLAELFLVISAKWRITIPDIFLHVWAPKFFAYKRHTTVSSEKNNSHGAPPESLTRGTEE